MAKAPYQENGKKYCMSKIPLTFNKMNYFYSKIQTDGMDQETKFNFLLFTGYSEICTITIGSE